MFILDVKSVLFKWLLRTTIFSFKAAFKEAIQRHAPIKKWYVQTNQAPFMKKKTKTDSYHKEDTSHKKIFHHKKWHW